MSNMSYCRFRNTYKDLLDCYEAASRIILAEEDDPLSPDELDAAVNLVSLCAGITAMFADALEIPVEDFIDRNTPTEAAVRELLTTEEKE